jgi:enoyl-CoA hydratase/carnithine racemase
MTGTQPPDGDLDRGLYQGLELRRQDSVAIVTLANPPANTWTVQSLAALRRLVADLDAARDVYSLVITGHGDKFFSAGADLKLFADGDKAVARAMARSFGEAFEALANFRGVSIAAINGYAMGGGLECALACDIRIAEEQASMALPEAAVGLLPCAGGTQLLSWLVGEGWAKRMILCGERVDASTALRIGLVEETVARGLALHRALELAQTVARQSPSSVTACKRLIQGARRLPPAHNLPAEREAFVDLFDTADQREGVAAFLGKRAPQWRNG